MNQGLPVFLREESIVNISLSPEIEKQAQERAAARGLDVATYLSQLIEQDSKNGVTTPSPRGTVYWTSRPIIRDEDTRPRPLPQPRGLLPVPPEVQCQVEADAAKHQPYYTEAYRKLVTDFLTLSYYYGGQQVAYRKTHQGVEVLAVGLDEIGRLRETLSAEENLTVIHTQPDIW